MSIGAVHFFRGPLFGRNAIFLACPFAEVDQLTSLTAERTMGVAGIFSLFLAGWAFHGAAATSGFFQ
jgi:hypothetical protein